MTTSTSTDNTKWELAITALGALTKCVDSLTTVVDRSLSEHDRLISELAQAVADLDDGTPSRHAHDQLALRLDAIEDDLKSVRPDGAL